MLATSFHFKIFYKMGGEGRAGDRLMICTDIG